MSPYIMIARTSSSGLCRNKVRRLWPRNALIMGRKLKPCFKARKSSLDGGIGGFGSFASREEDRRRLCWKFEHMVASGYGTRAPLNLVERNCVRCRSGILCIHRVCRRLLLEDSIAVAREAAIANDSCDIYHYILETK